MEPQPPNITSFIIRFVHAESAAQPEISTEATAPFRGSIRHIQSDREFVFLRWEEAVAFIRQYVPLEAETPGEAGTSQPERA